MKRLLTILGLLAWSLPFLASQTDNRDAAKTALAKIDSVIAQEAKNGDIEKESQARWQKIVTLKNFSKTREQADEAGRQMEWFREHKQWDKYYRTWQLKANALSAMGKLQMSLQETQRMLSDAKERDNKLGRAMAYKQIGVIYLNMKQTEPAIEALRHYAELMNSEEGDISSLSNIYYRIAKAYDYDKDYHQELQVTDEWLDFIREKAANNPKADKAEVQECYNSCYLAKAAAYIGLGDMEHAGLALDTAYHYVRQINTSLSLHHYYKMKARYHLARGEAQKALLFTDSVSMTTNERDDHTEEVKAQALISLGQGTDAALIYQRLYHDKDSVFGREARQHLDELNTLFQVDELKTEQQHARLRYTMIVASIIVLALLILLLYGWYTAIRQKKVNEQLRIANEKAKVSSKMKSEFIRNISHEIRTPLNIISGFTQVLTAPDIDLPKDEKQDIQERISENTSRITKLIDRMLELSDTNSETLIERHDHTDVQTIIAQAINHSRIDLHTLPADKNSAVEFQVEDNPETNSLLLLTNKLHATRVVAQLLENAMKFTPKGNITLKTERTDTILRFIVEDTGIGVPTNETEHIFEEFVQLDSFSDGTGVGLSIARSVAQRMGGNLWIDKDYKQGARFIFELLIS